MKQYLAREISLSEARLNRLARKSVAKATAHSFRHLTQIEWFDAHDNPDLSKRVATGSTA